MLSDGPLTSRGALLCCRASEPHVTLIAGCAHVSPRVGRGRILCGRCSLHSVKERLSHFERRLMFVESSCSRSCHTAGHSHSVVMLSTTSARPSCCSSPHKPPMGAQGLYRPSPPAFWPFSMPAASLSRAVAPWSPCTGPTGGVVSWVNPDISISARIPGRADTATAMPGNS